jgi:L-glyceraldehyde 3-phosphate reductase
LYAAISSYDAERSAKAAQMLRDLGTPCLIHQPAYNILNRWVEGGLLATLETEGVGCIAFCPLAQGLLTNKYLGGVPEGSRAAKAHGTLKESQITESNLAQVRQLNEIASGRGQSLAQMSLAWVLRHPGMTSALIGASKPEQVLDCIGALKNLDFSDEELAAIDQISPAPGQ